MTEYIPLSRLPIGITATVVSISAGESEIKRLNDLGLVPGTTLKAIMASPLGDPVAYLIRGAIFAIRCEDAETITVLRD